MKQSNLNQNNNMHKQKVLSFYCVPKILALMAAIVFSMGLFAQQQLGALLAPQPGADVVEYIDVAYSVDKANNKLVNVTISNGMAEDKMGRDFKSKIELLNMLGRAGWAYINEKQTDEKGNIRITISLSRTINANNRQMRPNMPERQPRMTRDNQPDSNPAAIPQKDDTKKTEKK